MKSLYHLFLTEPEFHQFIAQAKAFSPNIVFTDSVLEKGRWLSALEISGQNHLQIANQALEFREYLENLIGHRLRFMYIADAAQS